MITDRIFRMSRHARSCLTTQARAGPGRQGSRGQPKRRGRFPCRNGSAFRILSSSAAPPAQRRYPASRSRSARRSQACSNHASAHREQLSVATAPTPPSRQSRRVRRDLCAALQLKARAAPAPNSSARGVLRDWRKQQPPHGPRVERKDSDEPSRIAPRAGRAVGQAPAIPRPISRHWHGKAPVQTRSLDRADASERRWWRAMEARIASLLVMIGRRFFRRRAPLSAPPERARSARFRRVLRHQRSAASPPCAEE
jgi:hypothetical protein